MNMVTDLFYECKLLLSRLVVLGCTRIDHFSGLKIFKGNWLPRTDFDLSCGKSVVVLLRFSNNLLVLRSHRIFAIYRLGVRAAFVFSILCEQVVYAV